MAVPEAAVNEKGNTMLREQQVGSARRTGWADAVAKTAAVQAVPQGQFRGRV